MITQSCDVHSELEKIPQSFMKMSTSPNHTHPSSALIHLTNILSEITFTVAVVSFESLEESMNMNILTTVSAAHATLFKYWLRGS